MTVHSRIQIVVADITTLEVDSSSTLQTKVCWAVAVLTVQFIELLAPACLKNAGDYVDAQPAKQRSLAATNCKLRASSTRSARSTTAAATRRRNCWRAAIGNRSGLPPRLGYPQ